MSQLHAFHQAAKMNGRWAYSPFRRRPIGPFHPAAKGALICVTRAGQIRLIYQNPDSKWSDLPADLKNTGYSDRLLTHAAMVATQGNSSTTLKLDGRLSDVSMQPVFFLLRIPHARRFVSSECTSPGLRHSGMRASNRQTNSRSQAFG